MEAVIYLDDDIREQIKKYYPKLKHQRYDVMYVKKNGLLLQFRLKRKWRNITNDFRTHVLNTQVKKLAVLKEIKSDTEMEW